MSVITITICLNSVARQTH